MCKRICPFACILKISRAGSPRNASTAAQSEQPLVQIGRDVANLLAALLDLLGVGTPTRIFVKTKAWGAEQLALGSSDRQGHCRVSEVPSYNDSTIRLTMTMHTITYGIWRSLIGCEGKTSLMSGDRCLVLVMITVGRPVVRVEL